MKYTYTILLIALWSCFAGRADAQTERPSILVLGNVDLCPGGQALLDAGEGYESYRWNTGETSQTLLVEPTEIGSVEYWADVVTADAETLRTDTVEIRLLGTIQEPMVSYDAENNVLRANAHPDNRVRWFRLGSGFISDQGNEATPTISGSYFAQVDNPDSCSVQSITITVDVGEPLRPAVDLDGSPVFCLGETLQLSATEGFTNYRWSFGATGRTQQYRPDTAGFYEIFAFAQNEEGEDVASDTIMVQALPSPVTPVLTFDAQTEILSATGSGNYQWFLNGAPLPGAPNVNSIPAEANGDYSVRLFNNEGCSRTSNTVSVALGGERPVVQILGDPQFCLGDSVEVTTTAAYASYEWSFGDTTRTATVQPETTGIVNVSVRVVTAEGDTLESDPASITVIALPQTPVVEYDSVNNLLVSTAGAGNYQWYFDQGGFNDIEIFGANQSTYRPGTVGSYYLRVRSGNGCFARSESVAVDTIAPARPTFQVEGPTTFCVGGSVVLRADPGFEIYEWSTGLFSQDVFIAPAEPGNYEIWLRASRGADYEAFSDTIIVSVLALPNTPVLTYNTLTNTLRAEGANAPVFWYRGTGLPSDTLLTQSASETYQPEASGNYYVVSSFGADCQIQTEPQFVRVCIGGVARPSVVVEGGDRTVCGGDTVVMRLAESYASYAWNTGETTAAITFAPDAPGEYQFYAEVPTECGRLVSDTVLITVFPRPETPQLFYNEEDNILFTNVSGLYVWYQGNEEFGFRAIDTAAGFSITPTLDAEYYVEVFFPGACVLESNRIYLEAGDCEGIRQPIIGAASEQVICRGDSIALGVSRGQAYRWNSGERTQTIVTAPEEDSAYYWAAVRTSCGRVLNSDTLLVRVLDLPEVPSVSYEPETRFATAIAPGGFVEWYRGTGAPDDTLLQRGDYILKIEESGNYYARVINSNGCSSFSDPVFYALCDFEGVPSIVYGDRTAICVGDQLELTAQADDDFARVEWSFGPETQTAIFAPQQPGVYNLTYTAVTLCGERVRSEAARVEVYPFPETPVVSYAPEQNLLQTQPQDLLQWYRGAFAETDTALSAETDETMQPLDPGNYYVTATSPGGCSDTSDLIFVESVNLEARPLLSLMGADTICVGETTMLAAGHGFLNYEWNIGATEQVVEYQGFTPGVFEFYAIVELPEGGSRNTDTLIVVVLERPETPEVAYDAETNRLTATGEGALQWYFLSDEGEESRLTGVTTAEFQPTVDGRYFVEVTNEAGCATRSAEVFVEICDFSRNPNIRLTGPASFCLGGEVVLRADNGFEDYAWSFDTTNAPVATFRPEESGTFELYVDVPLACGLTISSDTLTVEVFDLPETPELTFDPVARLLEAESDDDLLWFRGAGTPAQDTLLRIEPDVREYEVEAAGNYYVIARNENGCADTSDVVRADLCDPDFKPYIEPAGALAFCLGGQVALDAGVEGVAYEWSNGETTRSIIVAPEEDGEEDFYVVVEYACGFMVSDTITVEAFELPERPTISRIEDTDTLEAEGDAFLQWFLIDQEGETFVLNGATKETHLAEERGGYFVETRNEDGCSALSDTLMVETLVSRSETLQIDNLSVYPNPAQNTVALTGDWAGAQIVRVQCIDANGKTLIDSAQPAAQTLQIDVSSLAAGVYMLSVEAGERSQTLRLIKY